MGPKVSRSTTLSPEQEAIAVPFSRHTLLRLDDCLYALQATIPGLSRSSSTACASDTQSRGCPRGAAPSSHLTVFLEAYNFTNPLRVLRRLTP
jgi:hypothetical protein